MTDQSAVLLEILRWLSTLLAAAVPFLVRWVWSLGTRVAVAENEIRYLKAEVATDRKHLLDLPSDIKVIKAELTEIKRRLAAEESRNGRTRNEHPYREIAFGSEK